MNVLVTGATGHLGPALLRSLDSGKYRVCSIGSGPLPSAMNGLLKNVSHTQMEIGEDHSIDSVLADFLPQGAKFGGAVLMAGRGKRGVGFDVKASEFRQDLSETPGTLYSTIASLHHYLAEGASVVAFSSLWGEMVPQTEMYLDLKNEPSYSLVAAWGAQRQLIRYIARELASRGIRVNAVQPGWFPRPRLPLREDYMAVIKRSIPLARVGQPEDLVGAVKFLLSEDSAYITGQTIVVDGGYSLK